MNRFLTTSLLTFAIATTTAHAQTTRGTATPPRGTAAPSNAIVPSPNPRSGAAPAQPNATPKISDFEKYIRTEIEAGLDAVQADTSPQRGQDRLLRAFDLVISRGTARDAALFRDADVARRLAGQVSELALRDRRDTIIFLRRHDAVARELVLALDDQQPASPAYELFTRFRTQRPAQLDTFASLAAAICAVHGKPLVRHVNEVTVRAPDPIALFDFYVANEAKMMFGIRNMPVELLAYVVDSTVTIDELKWALQHYNRDQNIGRHFFDVHYDYDSYRYGKAKLLNQVPYTLPNILQVGGICADQAYFATQIAKAIGVPSGYTSGQSAEVSHAWVGFLQVQGKSGGWNFDSGRYEEYRGVRGIVEDPRTREPVPDAVVSFTAELINTRPVDRQTAAALVDAAGRMAVFDDRPDAFAADLPPDLAAAQPVARRPGINAELDLLADALRANPGSADAWATVGTLAQLGKMSLEQKKFWSDELFRQSAQKYPDFAVAILAPMIETVEDPAQQNALWNMAFEQFKNRADLAAFLRMKQAAFWERQKDVEKAGACYLDVIDRYANAGPFVLQALTRAEAALPDAGKLQRSIALHEATWAKCKKPGDMAGEFSTQSNWFRVGSMLVQRLLAAGNTQRARAVQNQLDPVGNK